MRHHRYHSPVKSPQGLAWDGASLWVTSAANGRVYSLARKTLACTGEYVPPAEALGITWTGNDFRVVLAPFIEEPNDLDRRFVYVFSPDGGFSECFECPGASGSFLAWNNGALYVSQAWDKRIVEVDAHGVPVRTIDLERRPVGMTIVDDVIYQVSIDDEWIDGRFERFPLHRSDGTETLDRFDFKPRGVAFDGDRFWIADRNGDALLTLDISDAR